MENADILTTPSNETYRAILDLMTMTTYAGGLASRMSRELEEKLHSMRLHIESLHINKMYSLRQQKRNDVLRYSEMMEAVYTSEQLASQLRQLSRTSNRVTVIVNRLILITPVSGRDWRDRTVVLLNNSGESLHSLELAMNRTLREVKELRDPISLNNEKFKDLLNISIIV